jgi:hypothetical protein
MVSPFLFEVEMGLTATGGGQFVISDKTISRQHLIVEVDPVASSECVSTLTMMRDTQTELIERLKYVLGHGSL